MPIEFLSTRDCVALHNPGVVSEQIVWPRNCPNAKVTITRVTIKPGATTPRHSHPGSEQIWIVEQGRGTFLMEGGQTTQVSVGDVIRTPPGETHGLTNTGSEPFVYLSATTPPIDVTTAYESSTE